MITDNGAGMVFWSCVTWYCSQSRSCAPHEVLVSGTGWKFGARTRIKRPLRLLSLVIDTAEAHRKFAMKQSPR